MRAQIHWDEQRRRVDLELHGFVDEAENRAIVSAVVDDARFGHDYSLLSDHTGLDRPITSEQLAHFLRLLRRRADRLRHVRWAIVTERDASYGMMRMLSVHLEGVLRAVRVFRSRASAEAWLASRLPPVDRSSGTRSQERL